MLRSLLYLAGYPIAWGWGYLTGWSHARRGCARSCAELEAEHARAEGYYARLVEAGLAAPRPRAGHGMPPLDPEHLRDTRRLDRS